MPEHPIDRLYRAGVSLNVNSDSRMLTPTTLTTEYEILYQVFNWTVQDFQRANMMGVDAAFASHEIKEQLRKRIAECV
jgi:adenosine deaminase